MDHGFAGFNEGGKVEHAVEGVTLIAGSDEKVFKRFPIRELPLHEFHSRWKQVAASVAQIIEHNRGMPFRDKEPGDGTTYVPRTSGNQYLHKKAVLSYAL
jgi:hypothetical protein